MKKTLGPQDFATYVLLTALDECLIGFQVSFFQKMKFKVALGDQFKSKTKKFSYLRRRGVTKEHKDIVFGTFLGFIAEFSLETIKLIQS